MNADQRRDSDEPLFGDQDIERGLDRDGSRKKHLKFVAEIGSAPDEEVDAEASRQFEALRANWAAEEKKQRNDDRPASDRQEYFVAVASFELGPDAEARLRAERPSLTPEQLQLRNDIGEKLLWEFVGDAVAMRSELRKKGIIEKTDRKLDGGSKALNAEMKHFESCFDLARRAWMAERARIGALTGRKAMDVKLSGEQFGELVRRDPKLFRMLTEGWTRDLLPNTELETKRAPRLEVPTESVVVTQELVKAGANVAPGELTVSPSTDEPLVKLLETSSRSKMTQQGVRPHVAPELAQAAATAPTAPTVEESPPPKRARRGLLLVGVVVGVIAIAALGWWLATLNRVDTRGPSAKLPEKGQVAPARTALETVQDAPSTTATAAETAGTGQAPAATGAASGNGAALAPGTSRPAPPASAATSVPAATTTVAAPPATSSSGKNPGNLWKGGE